jgi:DNA-3-methyladenine glycosylase II
VRFGQPDVLAIDDYGIRKGFAKIHKLAELPKPKELLAYGERWRPYRSVASWHLWRAAEMKDLPMAGKQPKKAAAKRSTRAAPAKSKAKKSRK